MNLSFPTSVHCINPDCLRPASQTAGNKFCQSCGTPLLLNNRYIPLQKLGSGGFAVTYTVCDLKFQTERVLKLLVETSPQALRLFEQEAAVLASLRHPGVPRVESGSYFQVQLPAPHRRTLPCLVMEKINGQTLEDFLDRYPKGCPEALVLDWLCQAADILQVLHRRKIVHRDLKPANFMLRTPPHPGGAGEGKLVVIDFGGVKQIATALQKSQRSSTRVVSPGYSPPEQIAGALIGPAADFYALGRTCIHLLTGRYPADLDDPVTGQCRWHHHARVSPVLAILIDEMVQPAPEFRPASAAEIAKRLRQRSSRQRPQVTAQVRATGSSVTVVLRAIFKPLWQALTAIAIFLYEILAGTVLAITGAVWWLVRGFFDTLLGMVMAGFGGSVGAGIGFWLAYKVPAGIQIVNFLSQQLVRWIPDTHLTVERAVLVFGLAGLGTALGLTEAGSFGQFRQFGPAGLMGILGYVLGWFALHAIAPAAATAGSLTEAWMAFTAIAIAALTLGLGLRGPLLLHASLAAIGTATLIAGLVSPSPSSFFPHLLPTAAGGIQLADSIVFFALLGSACAFCLGVSYYLLVPCLRFLGFR
ncbi:MAG: serine/threonine protein kinase [Oscillatoria princeps RMCB-10]|nr:serine/threonine protein kinase [Oscillatoria princeps RMCB-10]